MYIYICHMEAVKQYSCYITATATLFHLFLKGYITSGGTLKKLTFIREALWMLSLGLQLMNIPIIRFNKNSDVGKSQVNQHVICNMYMFHWPVQPSGVIPFQSHQTFWSWIITAHNTLQNLGHHQNTNTKSYTTLPSSHKWSTSTSICWLLLWSH